MPSPRRLGVPLVLVFCLQAASTTLWGAPLLPDLRIDSKSPQSVTEQGRRLIRFTTLSSNIGVGPMELRGGAVNGDQQQVDQRIYDSNGGFSDRPAGVFIYHQGHGHIHFEEFADYYLKEVTAGDGVGGIVGMAEKVSFCLLDIQKVSPPHPGTRANAFYLQCESYQGISVGWADVYDYTLPGQSIDVTGVSNGIYWLESTVDRANRMLESDETNNTSRVQVAVITDYRAEIGLSGNGQPIASGDVSPTAGDHSDFGNVALDSGSTTRTFTIHSTGTGTLSLTGVPRVQVIGSSAFSVVTQPPSPLAGNGGVATFQIAFNPQHAGTHAATVRITNNDTDEKTYEFAIRGSVPELRQLQRIEGGFELTFDSIAGRTYRIEYKNEVTDPEWLFLEQRMGTDAPITVTDAGAGERRFYRLIVGP